jgi:phosphatidate phosphatase APP1
MASIKGFFKELLRHLDNLFDRLQRRLRTIRGWGRNLPLTIHTYRGFGRPDYVHLQGRVLKYKPLHGINSNSRWRSFIDSYRRFGTDEIQGAQLNISIGSNTFDVVTDEEGFFLLDRPLRPEVPPSKTNNWKLASVKLKRTPWEQIDLQTEAEILMPSGNAEFGVISDIDDTILHTHVTSILKLKMLYYTLFKNAAGRRPMQEAASFYQGLHQHQAGGSRNPFFYVSNSPWNLYDLLQDFLSINHFPKGPILLRDFGVPKERAPSGQRGHKYETITRILLTYPNIPFLLIGDSGERDADIYLEIAKGYPNRIRHIYIREVKSSRRAERIAHLIRDATDVNIRLIHHYREAAADAADEGLLDMKVFEELREKLKRR